MWLLIIFGALGLFQLYQGWQTHKTVKILHEMQAVEGARSYMPSPEFVYSFGFAPTVVDGDMTEKSPAPE